MVISSQNPPTPLKHQTGRADTILYATAQPSTTPTPPPSSIQVWPTTLCQRGLLEHDRPLKATTHRTHITHSPRATFSRPRATRSPQLEPKSRPVLATPQNFFQRRRIIGCSSKHNRLSLCLGTYYRFEGKSSTGAVLITSAPDVHERVNHKTPFKRWVVILRKSR